MRVFLVLLGDALREARDKKALWVLGVIGVALVLFFASVAIEPARPDAALARTAGQLGRKSMMRALMETGTISTSIEVEAGEPRAARPDDDFPLGSELFVIELRFPRRHALDQLCSFVDPERAPGPTSREEREAALRTRFANAGFAPVFVRPLDADELEWRVAAGADRPLEIAGGARVSFLFGALSRELEEMPPATLLALMQVLVADQFAGFLGLLVLLSVFSGALPDLLQKGRFDLVIARPVGRARVVALRYLGVVAFVAAAWGALFFASALALRFATGYVGFGLVRCALPCALIFAALYPAALLVGALTRNATLALLGGLLPWGAQSVVASLLMMREAEHLPLGDTALRALEVARAVLPRISDLEALNLRALAAEQLSPELLQRVLGDVPADGGWRAAAATAGFAAVLLALTCRLVARRDG